MAESTDSRGCTESSKQSCRCTELLSDESCVKRSFVLTALAAHFRWDGSAFARALAVVLVVGLVGCAGWQVEEARLQPVRLKILHTSDVHGWLNPHTPRKTRAVQGGLAELAAAWKLQEGYDVATQARVRPRPLLVLDSGDMWTGPPESTLAEGAPMIDAFNALGYDAAAIGNHEFDFGIDIIRQHKKNALFAFLSSNIRSRPQGPTVDFCEPSSLIDVGGLKVGVIGLTTLETPQTTFPTRVEGLEFLNYEPQVREQGERLLERGAKVLVVIAHEPVGDLKPTAESITDLPIRVWLGGHSHRRELEVIERDPLTDADDVVMLNPGAYARAYGRIELLFGVEKGLGRGAGAGKASLLMHTETIVPVESTLDAPPQALDQGIVSIVKKASDAVEDKMKEPLGTIAEPMPSGTRDRSPLGEWVADRWLEAFPQAQIAITNLGGIRQSLEPGPLTMRDVFSVLPFANDLVLIHLTPAQLREALSGSTMLVGGIRYAWKQEGETRVVTRIELPDGTPLDENQRYGVLTTDFLYAGGDNMPFKRMDPQPVMLGVSWRDPVIGALRKNAAQQTPAPVVPPPAGRVREEGAGQ